MYSVSLDGKGKPERIPIGYGAWLSYSPDGKQVAFNRYANEGRSWKRYAGGWSRDIWIGDLETRQYHKITEYPGADEFPVWYNDRIYFMSDRTGERNLFSIHPKTRQIWQHTFHTGWDMRWPSLGGDRIVYQRGADLWYHDLKTHRTHEIPITLPTDAIRRQRRFVSLARYHESFDLGPEGKRLLITSRGSIFNIPVKEGVPLRITRTSDTREKYASFSRDGRSILALSDRSGEDELVLYDALGEKPPRPITKNAQVTRFWPTMSPDQKSVAFSDKDLKLWIASVETGELTLVEQKSIWEIRSYAWSPDSRYLAYVKHEANWLRSILIYDTKTKQTIRATHPWTDDFSPAWAADGKHLYFLSKRQINPSFGSFDFTDTVDQSTKIYALALSSKSPASFEPKDELLEQRNKEESDARKKASTQPATKPSTQPATTTSLHTAPINVFAPISTQPATKPSTKPADEQQKDKKTTDTTSKKAKKDGESPKSKKKPVVVQIDVDGLADRVYEVPNITAKHYFGLFAIKDRLFVMSHPTVTLGDEQHQMPKWLSQLQLHVYPFAQKKLLPIASGVQSYAISSDHKFIALRRGPAFRVMPTSALKEPPDPKTLVNVAQARFEIDPTAEWKQILMEAWRLQRDFYWDPNMVKVPWKQILKRYLSILPRILTRDELNDLLGEMIGELGTSHTYVWGGDSGQFDSLNHGLLGADLQPDPKSGLYRITRILRGAPWSQDAASPLAAHHLKLQEGHYIIAINGQDLTADDNYYRFLQHKAQQVISLLVNDKPSREGARRITIKAISWMHDRNLRYVDWVESRRKLTLKLSGGKVGYIHLPDMSGAGLIAFYKMWYPQLHKKAMIIDVRSNGGGFVSQLIIQKLMRRIWAFFKARNAPISENVPQFTFHGHLAALSNANTGSDGDIFCKSFQLNDLGPVIGTRTWGGVVGIRMLGRTIDQGMTTQPEYAWWTPSVGWNIENHGITPDIFVDNTPSELERDIDRQLQTAVEWLLKQLEKDPKTLPPLPPYPDKSIESFRKKMQKWQAPPAPGTKTQHK
jgi:tricorn protease